jgi:hypothetical protein
LFPMGIKTPISILLSCPLRRDARLSGVQI